MSWKTILSFALFASFLIPIVSLLWVKQYYCYDPARSIEVSRFSCQNLENQKRITLTVKNSGRKVLSPEDIYILRDGERFSGEFQYNFQDLKPQESGIIEIYENIEVYDPTPGKSKVYHVGVECGLSFGSKFGERPKSIYVNRERCFE